MANTKRARKKVASPETSVKKKGSVKATNQAAQSTVKSHQTEPTKLNERSRITRSTAQPDQSYLRQQPAFPKVLALSIESVLSSSSSSDANDDDDDDANDNDHDNEDGPPKVQSKKNHNYKTTGEEDEDIDKDDAFYSPDENEDDDDDDDNGAHDDDDGMMDSDIEIMCNNVMQANEYKKSSVAKERKLTNRKQYDKQRIMDAKVGAINATEFSGQTSPTIRPMTEVEAFPLKKNHTFNDKNILLLRIAEEANLRGIRLHVLKSNPMSVHVRGYKFVVRANFSTLKGWHCSRVQCREGEYQPLAEDAKYGDDEAGETNDDEQAGADEEEEEEDDDETDHGKTIFIILLML